MAKLPLKQIFGITGAKCKIARATGIPTTKSGRKRKARRMVGLPESGGGFFGSLFNALFGSGKRK